MSSTVAAIRIESKGQLTHRDGGKKKIDILYCIATSRRRQLSRVKYTPKKSHTQIIQLEGWACFKSNDQKQHHSGGETLLPSLRIQNSFGPHNAPHKYDTHVYGWWITILQRSLSQRFFYLLLFKKGAGHLACGLCCSPHTSEADYLIAKSNYLTWCLMRKSPINIKRIVHSTTTSSTWV